MISDIFHLHFFLDCYDHGITGFCDLDFPRGIIDKIIEMTMALPRPLSLLSPTPCVYDDEEELPSSEVVDQLLQDLIGTVSLDSQKDCNQICNDILLDSIGLVSARDDVIEDEARSPSGTTTPHLLEEGNTEGPSKVCQDVLMSLVAKVVKEPQIICKEVVSEFVESIFIEKSKTSNKEPTAVSLRILKALDNLYK